MTGAASEAHAELERLQINLRDAVLHVVWRQWRTLGAGASSRSAAVGHELNTLIDPEALVLVSLLLVPEERRLADLLHDWAAKNADLLSVQRMKNLEGGYPDSVRPALVSGLAWFASVARDECKDLRWRSVAQTWEAERPDEAESGLAEYAAERFAVRAGTKSRATRVRLTSNASLLPRLRLGFGVGARADVVAYLLACVEDWSTVREISDATAYTAAAVRRTAEDLAAARLVEALEGQVASYRARYDAWAPLLGLDARPPRWGSWNERFMFAADFLQWIDTIRERPMSEYALGVQGRRLLEQHRAAVERDLIAVWSDHSSIDDWGAYLSRTVRSLVRWMEEMA